MVCRQTEIFHYFLNNGANVSHFFGGLCVIHLAILLQEPDYLRAILEACPDEANRWSDLAEATALHLAIGLRNVECIKLLLEHGADPNKKNSQDMSCYDIADPVMRAILDQGKNA